MEAPRLVMFTRFPEPGKAKTRLIPAIGEEGAAAVHERLAKRTVGVALESGLPLEVRITGAPAARFAEWLGGGTAYVEQGDGDLGARLKRAAELPVIFIGTDCPDLSARHLAQAAEALTRAPVVIGPAEDGGYWLIGLAARHDYLFEDMNWGTEYVLPTTLARLEDRAIEPVLLETLADCDRPEDLDRWPDLWP